jgi:inorganic pyrophosphatase
VSQQPAFPDELEVIVEIARWGLVKRAERGGIDLISPLPCPFNYGSVPSTHAADGDREDVVLLGSRLPIGHRLRAPVLGRVRFIDAGCDDDKWLCGAIPLGAGDRLQVELFFATYARVKRVLNALRGRTGATRYAGLELRPG